MPSCLDSYQETLERVCFQAHLSYWQIQFFVVSRLRSFSPCWLLARSLFQLFKITCISHYIVSSIFTLATTNQILLMILIPDFSLCRISSDSIVRKFFAFKGSCNQIEPSQKNPWSSPFLKVCNLNYIWKVLFAMSSNIFKGSGNYGMSIFEEGIIQPITQFKNNKMSVNFLSHSYHSVLEHWLKYYFGLNQCQPSLSLELELGQSFYFTLLVKFVKVSTSYRLWQM